MRVRAPQPFKIALCGPEGPYELSFHRYSDWDGYLDVTIGPDTYRWQVERADEENGELSISGMTSPDTANIWGDWLWFQLTPSGEDPRIEYWGDQLVRTDRPNGEPN